MPISSNNVGLRPGVCTSTTRPTTPYTGQIIYETDTGYLRVWDGSAWDYLSQKQDYSQGLGAGKILQVVNTTYGTITSSSSVTYADTNLAASITPSATSNKILCFVSMPIRKSAGSSLNELNLRLMRGTTDLLGVTGQLYTGTALEMRGGMSLSYLDSPSTTSSTTYKMQFANGTGAAEVSVHAYGYSTMTLMEVAA